jgi:MFS family permease
MVEGALYAVMIGLGESYLGAFAVQLGHSDTHLALLVTVPLLVGALAQLLSGPLVTLLGTWRRTIVVGACAQALSQAGFVAIAVWGDRGLAPLLLVKTLFWTSGAIIAPAWNAWMAALVSGRERERFFAWRGGVVHLALVVAYFAAGAFLQAHEAASNLLHGFALLFGVAIVARLASAVLLHLHTDATDPVALGPGTAARARLALREGRWRIAVLVTAVGFGVHFAAPFFTPYILRDLGLGYTAYAALTSVAVLVKALVYPLAYRAAERFGLGAVCIASGLGVSAIPLLWSSVHLVEGLIVVECLSGVAWAGFEFASLQLLLEGSPSPCRVEFFSLASSLQGLAQLAGALAGSWVLATFALSYTDVFALSGVLRATAVLVVAVPLLPLLRRVPIQALWAFPISVRAVAGVVTRPFVRNRQRPAERPVTTPTDAGAPPTSP